MGRPLRYRNDAGRRLTRRQLPAPQITTYIDREDSAAHLSSGESFHIGRIDMVANTGTYLDSPFHFHADGTDVAAVPLERVAEVPIVMIRASRLSWVDAREASSLPRIQSSANRAAADDNPLLRMATRPLASPPLPLEHLARL